MISSLSPSGQPGLSSLIDRQTSQRGETNEHGTSNFIL